MKILQTIYNQQITGNINIGVGMIAIIFCIGTVIFFKSVSMNRKHQKVSTDKAERVDTSIVEIGTI